ncbi:segregation/condensation protein A [Candidatus Woesearchaeota archaeon]|nr:segregation/condensation protein A [Candidatus Woesearchaeota archaeon]
MNKEQQRLAEPENKQKNPDAIPEVTLLPHEQLFDMILNKDDISWQQIIFTAIKSEQMNPWDIDIKLLSQKFLEKLRQFKEMDFKISGKVILAAAIMLRLKSNKLIGEDMNYLDQLIASGNQSDEDAFYDELSQMEGTDRINVSIEGRNYELIPRTPQPRKRKVSVYDLVEALEKALEVKNRRKGWGEDEIHMEIPVRKVDIDQLIQKTFGEVMGHFMTQKEAKLLFSKLLKEGTKLEKVYTFIPLLHLSNEGKVNLQQEVHLGEIHITLGERAHEPLEVEKKS